MPVPLIIVGLVVLVALVGHFTLRPRMLRWGASPAEAARTMAGDDLIPRPSLATTRAINIKAGTERVWPWLAQMGQGRGGFYSYEWLENLAGLDIHNSDRIVPELQDLKPGDLIPFWRGAGINVVEVAPGRLLVLAGTLNPPKGKPAAGAGQSAGAEVQSAATAQVGGTWVFALERLEPSPGRPDAARPGTQQPGGTRLIVRARVATFPPAWLSAISMLILAPMHFVMERKMLKGIKERAERQ